jgi:hypothetical protein
MREGSLNKSSCMVTMWSACKLPKTEALYTIMQHDIKTTRGLKRGIGKNW